VVAGYLTVGLAAGFYTSYGPLRSVPLSALLHMPVLAGAAAGAGAWAERGRPRFALPAAFRNLLPTREAVTALQAAAAGTVVLFGGGALLVAGSLLWHAELTGRGFTQLSAGLTGQLAVLLTAAALVPNAAVWGAAYALGPGFTVGAGSVVAPVGASGYPVLPDFPLLAALPGEGGGTPLTWSALLIPAAAGATVAWFASDDPGRRSAARIALVAACGAVGCGAAVGVLAAFASGPLGSGALSAFGPSPWITGVAALAWTAALGIPGALAFRWWFLRRSPLPAG
jgi:hypothetical protein